ncbi:alpha/beta fold hydrolase [Agromyces aerolatus]|uniref:alpha/beta fold hydrolase n=1 Tax=Agromyces sp. LY-1074 TaxID=3074080 RepID=UPI00285D7D3A|nr:MULTISPECIES: alpha/beta fold hydrolase [unclassified Agromyces]MDR5701185.1 alpha/beta fold hydrolase [Agromyces sp. LY-1074]MDR5706939.1 alpha/beta fold hydrolase [Agromyces sp. LY-1358]
MTTLLLHGLGADRRQPLELFGPILAESGERVIAIDVRAHGTDERVGRAQDFAIDRLADEIAASVRETDASGARLATDDPLVRAAADPGHDAPATAAGAAGPARAATPLTVIGISMGAAIALRLALHRLLPIERAVFVRPSFDDRSMPPNLRVFPVIGQLLHDAGAEGGLAEFRESTRYQAFARETPAGAKGLLSQFTAPRAAERAIRLVEVPRNRAFTDDAELAGLAARGIRSLVVAAPRDPVHPFELGERWAGALGAPLERVPARDDGLAAQTAKLHESVAAWLTATR